MQYSGKCNGCGLCCILGDRGDCPFLMRLGNGKTKCKIYGRHIGKHLGGGWYCNDIMNVPNLYPGCPYNNDKVVTNAVR